MNDKDNREGDDEQEQASQALIPVDQETILFHGKPLVVVRLPDGRAGVVLRWICENLHIDPGAQVARIRRTDVIADDLVSTQVQTDGGLQTMPTLALHGVAYWIATIDTRRMDRDDPRRIEILAYQRDVVDALYAWAARPRTLPAPTKLVPSEPIAEPTAPAMNASVDEWIQYHQQMLAVLEWRRDIENWQGSVETRLEGLEAITGLIPEILERLGPETLTPAHQRQVQAFVKQLSSTTGKHPATIYDELKTAFEVPRYQDIPEFEWEKVAHWFRVQLQGQRKR
jgi:hypothetical protein